jgi:hypothetical protein
VGFVAAAYLVVAGLFVAYALTVAARQRLIGELADAASHEGAATAPTSAAANASVRDPISR